MNKKTMHRRAFLRSCVAAALGSSVLYTAGVAGNAARAAAFDDYKALVCVYLAGGADSFNMIVPTESAGYADYAASRGGLAPRRDDLKPLRGVGYGVHPDAAKIADLYNANRLSVVANCGNLVRPLSAEEYRSGNVALPPQLFSHSDQQRLWMSGDPTGGSLDGWAGRIADHLVARQLPADPAINFNFGGINLLQSGSSVSQYSLTRQGKGYVTLHGAKPGSGGQRSIDAYRALARQARSAANPLVREYARIQLRAMEAVTSIQAALDDVPQLATEFTISDEQKFGRDLEVVAQMIAARQGLGARRQIFFIRLGGWDTHANQASDHPRLLQTLATGLDEFNRELDELGVSSQVTTFTATEFGRTLSANGDGTDHGWGGHHLVMGAAVDGGRIVGQMPDWKLGGADDAGKGRVIPSTSNDQYSATLARWFGVSEQSLGTIFPNLRNFSDTDLGFMKL